MWIGPFCKMVLTILTILRLIDYLSIIIHHLSPVIYFLLFNINSWLIRLLRRVIDTIGIRVGYKDTGQRFRGVLGNATDATGSSAATAALHAGTRGYDRKFRQHRSFQWRSVIPASGAIPSEFVRLIGWQTVRQSAASRPKNCLRLRHAHPAAEQKTKAFNCGSCPHRRILKLPSPFVGKSLLQSLSSFIPLLSTLKWANNNNSSPTTTFVLLTSAWSPSLSSHSAIYPFIYLWNMTYTYLYMYIYICLCTLKFRCMILKALKPTAMLQSYLMNELNVAVKHVHLLHNLSI